MNKLFTRSILSAGLGLALTAGTASAAPIVFTVDEGAVPGAMNRQFDADKITASYIENLTFVGNTFTADLVVTFNGYTLGGAGVSSQVVEGAEIFPQQYGLYANVTVGGTFQSAPDPTDATQTVFDFDPFTSTVDVFLDPNTVRGDGDDALILTANVIDPHPASDGSVTTITATGQVVGGTFTIIYLDAMTQGLGDQYFPDFATLVLRAVATGDVDETSNVTGQGGRATGEVSINFEPQQAPEPASMTLFGLALLGAGVTARRRRSA